MHGYIMKMIRVPKASNRAGWRGKTGRFQQEGRASLPAIHATELNAGRVIASLSTCYRVLRADGERRAQRAPGQHAVPHLIADRPHACWSWDISKLSAPS